ncbi:MFS transporter [Actinokineospora sp. G85]|uniref:MFS transporter n=1 Tax=Actinokineospora sp. G85 TaxID=3406626 RepID=UPI003C776C8C
MTRARENRDRFGVLSVPGFGRLWLCSTADAWGAFLLPVAVTLSMLRGGQGATALGLVLAAKTLGHLLATIPGGIAADHWSRPTMISLACLARVLSTSVLLFFLDGPLWLVAACVFVLGAGEGVLRPSHLALVGDIVPESQRQSAIALTTVAFRIALVLSPGLATGLTLWSGSRTVLVVSLVLWLCAAFSIRKLPSQVTPHDGDPDSQRVPESVLDKVLGGFRAARRQRWFIVGLLVLTLVLGTVDATQMVLLPVISQERFGGESVYAVALSMFALGALSGGVVMLRWRPRRPGLFAVLGIGLCGLIPYALAFSSSAWPLFVAHFVAGVGMEVFNVAWFSAIQREFEPGVRARVTSLDFLVSYSISPLSLALVPVAVAGAGMRPVLVVMGTVVVIGCLAALAVPGMTRFRTAGAAEAEDDVEVKTG